MAIILVDSSSNHWIITIDDSGELHYAPTAAPASLPINLNDPTNSVSWQLGITTDPKLKTLPITFNASYPQAFPLVSNTELSVWNLGVTTAGELTAFEESSVIVGPSLVSGSQVNQVPPIGQIIPLTSSPNQSFSSSLLVDGAALTLQVAISWSELAGYWVMTILDVAGNLLLDSIPLITGWYPAANLLAQYGYLQIGSAFILNEGSSIADYPTRNDLGQSFILLWGDTAP